MLWHIIYMLLCWCIAVAASHGEHVSSTGAWTIPATFQYRLYADTANGIVHMIQAFHEQAALSRNLDPQRSETRAVELGKTMTHSRKPASVSPPPSVLDMGAGKGHYVLFFRMHGLNASGFEGVANIEELTAGVVQQHNLAQPLGDRECASAAADWVTCLEVGEHVHVWNAESLLRNINCTARLGVVISWAQPGQYGSGHVNLRSKAWVLDRFARMGFAYDTNATRAISGASKASHYLAKNIMVYRRPALLGALPSQAQPLLALPAEARRETALAEPSAADAAEAKATKEHVRCVTMLMQRSEARYLGGRRDAASAAEIRHLVQRLSHARTPCVRS